MSTPEVQWSHVSAQGQLVSAWFLLLHLISTMGEMSGKFAIRVIQSYCPPCESPFHNEPQYTCIQWRCAAALLSQCNHIKEQSEWEKKLGVHLYFCWNYDVSNESDWLEIAHWGHFISMPKMFLHWLEAGFLEEIKQLSSDGNTFLESICKPVVCHIVADGIHLSLI